MWVLFLKIMLWLFIYSWKYNLFHTKIIKSIYDPLDKVRMSWSPVLCAKYDFRANRCTDEIVMPHDAKCLIIMQS